MVCHRVWGDGHRIKRVHIPRAPVHATRSRRTRGIEAVPRTYGPWPGGL